MLRSYAIKNWKGKSITETAGKNFTVYKTHKSNAKTAFRVKADETVWVTHVYIDSQKKSWFRIMSYNNNGEKIYGWISGVTANKYYNGDGYFKNVMIGG